MSNRPRMSTTRFYNPATNSYYNIRAEPRANVHYGPFILLPGSDVAVPLRNQSPFTTPSNASCTGPTRHGEWYPAHQASPGTHAFASGGTQPTSEQRLAEPNTLTAISGPDASPTFPSTKSDKHPFNPWAKYYPEGIKVPQGQAQSIPMASPCVPDPKRPASTKKTNHPSTVVQDGDGNSNFFDADLDSLSGDEGEDEYVFLESSVVSEEAPTESAPKTVRGEAARTKAEVVQISWTNWETR